MLTTAKNIMEIDKNLTEDEKPLLEHFIKVATEKIEEYCNRKFEKSSFQDYIEGPTSHHNFKNFPVVSTTFTDFERLDTKNGIIYFKKPVKNLCIDYTAGFEESEIPNVLGLAILMYYKTFVQNGELRDFTASSYRLGDESINYVAIEKLFNGSIPTVVANLVSGLRGRI